MNPASSSPPPRILVIDDDPTMQAWLAAWLRQEGCRFELAPDAAAAEAMVRREEFDLVLCDIHLPDRSGLAIAETLNASHPGLPIIFLTGAPSVETAARSVQLRVVAYLVKPPDAPELRRLMREAVGEYRQRRALTSSRAQLREWDRELARLEQTLTIQPGPTSPGPLIDYFQLTVQQVARTLLDLERAIVPLAAADQAAEPLTKLDLLHAVQHTVAVLEKTRHSFKSKELGDLRKELEQLVARISREQA